MKVSAVIPAFNEEKTIGSVLKVVTTCSRIDEVIVVSDGSTDKTADVARQFSVKLVELNKNTGKGGALKAGVDHSQGEVIIFLDADLTGLTIEHLENMLNPVLNEQAEMVIGIFEKGRLTTDLAQVMAPYLSGQRVIKRHLLDGLDNMEMTRFGIEVALTRHAKNNNLKCQEVRLEKMSHVMKEEKLGLFKGFICRLRMYWDIIKVFGRKRSSLK